MNDSVRRIYLGLMFLGFSFLFSTAGYWLGYGWTLVDSIYMVVLTFFSVGYAEVRPILTPDLKLFTTLVIISGCTSVLYIVGGLIQMVTEGQIDRALDKRRNSKEIGALTDHVVVCGYGRHGQVLARELENLHRPFIVVDSNEARLEEARELGFLVYEGNATQEETLEAVGIDRAHTIATVLPDDAANVFITLSARTLNPDVQIIARGELPSTERKLLLAGANHVVLPASIGAERIVHIIARDDVEATLEAAEQDAQLNVDLAHLGMKVVEIDINSDSRHLGTQVAEVNLEHRSEHAILGVRRNDGAVILKPECTFHLEVGDSLLVIAKSNVETGKVAL